jgi:hypothetical protein
MSACPYTPQLVGELLAQRRMPLVMRTLNGVMTSQQHVQTVCSMSSHASKQGHQRGLCPGYLHFPVVQRGLYSWAAVTVPHTINACFDPVDHGV